MRRSRFSAEQIVAVLKQVELGMAVPDGWRAAIRRLATDTGVAGFTAFAALATAARPSEELLRLNYIRLAYEAQGGTDADALA